MRQSRLIVAGLFLLLVSAAAPLRAETRIALVIGNGGYRHVDRLANPANDARAVAAALRQAGFTLIRGGPQLDVGHAEMEQLIREFGRALTKDSVALFYYAGHGLQVAGVNWLVPVDADVASAADVKYELVDADFVLDEMSVAADRLNLVILDACRNNPFATRGLRGVGGGLAQVTAPAGTIIGYATQPGNVAMDGDGGNSPYSSALAKAIVEPGIGVIDALNLVGVEVQRGTGGRQQPWLALSPIEGRFAFVPGADAGGDLKPSGGAQPAAPAPFAPIPRTASSETMAQSIGTPPPTTAVAPPPGPSPNFRPWIRDLQLKVIDLAK
jgi:uncharacterized caspase-like protein